MWVNILKCMNAICIFTKQELYEDGKLQVLLVVIVVSRIKYVILRST